MSTLTRVARLDDDDNDVAYITVDLDGVPEDERDQLRVLSDDEDNEPLNRYGQPREATYPAAPEVAGQTVPDGYDAKSVAELRDEVKRRNADRAEDEQVFVQPPGNKPELVAALEADDKP